MAIDADRLRSIAAAYTEAWNSGRPEAVASFFSLEGEITINDGDPWRGRDSVANMAADFFNDVPDLCLTCDGVRGSDCHAVYMWTFTGTHSVTKRPLSISGWEEWQLNDAGLIERSRGNFDPADYAFQAGI